MTHRHVQAAPPRCHTEVAIVGAGPTGLSLALFLSRLGIRSTVFERRVDRSSAPRAHVINPRTLEIYRAFDLDVDRMIAEATRKDDDRLTWFVTRMADKTLGSLPFEKHDDTHTPIPRINLRQPALEAILLDAARQSELISIRVGQRVALVRAGSSNRESALLDVTGPDGHYEVEADYVLACDGANSPIRNQLGVAMRGQPDVLDCLSIHFEANLRNLVGDRAGILYWITAAEVPGALIAYDIDKTWCFLDLAAPEVLPNKDEARQIIHEILGTKDVQISVRQVVPWTMTAQVADTYRVERVFLLGDAAHRFPPAGGLGLNTGVQDAHNLAWKLAAVINGTAERDLLTTYVAERRPVAQMNTDQSLKNTADLLRIFDPKNMQSPQSIESSLSGMYDAVNSLGLQLGFTYGPDPAPPARVPVYEPSANVGDRLPHGWLDFDGRRVSTLDLLDRARYTLFTSSESAFWREQQWPVDVAVVDATALGKPEVARGWIELVGLRAGAILVRPDGHVLARTETVGQGAADHLIKAINRLHGGRSTTHPSSGQLSAHT